MKPGFDKRIFTAGILGRDMRFLLGSAPKMAGLARNPLISRPFMERIMTVVTAVNGCLYCSWFHARQAAESGMSEEEVRNLFDLQFHTDASAFELPALLFAQHYAETNRNPSAEMTRMLVDHYGDETAEHVMLVIRMIFFGNLLGNTFDAFLSRMRGNPAGDSNAVFETLFFAATAWFMWPAVYLARDFKARQAAGHS